MQRLARAGSGETCQLRVDRDDAVAPVEACGWEVDEVAGAPAAARGLVPPGHALPVDPMTTARRSSTPYAAGTSGQLEPSGPER